jgi:transcriptional regulator with GAF, ATPase, and Fis domain
MMEVAQLDSTIDRNSEQPAAPRRPAARMWVVYPPGDAPPIEIEGRVVIGRTSDGPLSHRTISRSHFVVDWDSGLARFVGQDLGSRNGTWVNGASLVSSRRALDDGAVVRLGDALLVLDVETAPIVEPTAEPIGDVIGAAFRAAVPGRAAATRRLRAELAAAARDASPVLLLGESGVGKEHVAAAIHHASERTGPFVAINCAELGADLVESQLFGHARGAFTGATANHDGVFRSADRGTLLLDEIGELPLAMQPKLLRALQQREVRPVGEVKPIAVDVRVVAATNNDLPVAVEAGAFRRDLYARLALWEIRVPPLRARRADILLWLVALHERWCASRDRAAAPLAFDVAAAEAILLAPWPDNLRGLDRLVHRIATLATTPIALADIATHVYPQPTPQAAPATVPAPVPVAPPVAAAKRPAPTADELRAVLAEHNGSVRAVAKYYGRDRKQIYRWIKDFGLD